MYKSPFSPPFGEASPILDNLILLPVSTPSGTLTSISFTTLTLPLPLHSLHTLSYVTPSPLHDGQVVFVRKLPNIVLCCFVILPLP